MFEATELIAAKERLRRGPQTVVRERGFVVDTAVDNLPCFVTPTLAIGAEDAAANTEAISAARITHILSVTADPQKLCADESVAFLGVPLLDRPDAELPLQTCLSFVRDAQRKGGRVFVHCGLGVSRSGAVVVAAVMKEREMRVEDALAFVRQARPSVRPNDGFMAQLRCWASCGMPC